MSLQKVPIYRIQAGSEQPDNTSFLRDIFRTTDQPAFEKLCTQILDLAKPLPKVRHSSGPRSRAIQVFKQVNQVLAVNFRQAGIVPEYVEAGWIFPTIALAAQAFGYTPATLTVMLHKARKASESGLDQDIEVRGWLIGYVDKSRSYRKTEKAVP